ncbi:MAG: hypothetical protein Unbinned4162contig1001_8 [Prokaryotic dsDNA virus sp.]|nr:MAG: hypothetical protein Unbinned4162contig1001_8 [Prokaryotic dsDNA virus sp.]|tara:strand:+ start:24359 stop:24934 length:576 start_codon:yes stop_codon:yes gene_type:complete
MLVLIDTDNMKAIKAAATAQQLFYWADILLPRNNYYVNDVTFDGLKGFNTEELKRIYANTTGDPIPKRCEGWEMMFGLVYNAVSNLMDDTDCTALYGKLGREPSQPNANERPKDTAPSVQRTGGTGKRSSGQRELIFEYADKKWAELGKPTDPKEIGRMRKAIMDELEPQGVKRTTCSTTLGAWQKQLQLG